MIKIEENIKLASYTTFKIGGPARFFCQVTKEEELVEAVRFAEGKRLAIFVLGGGSNILVGDYGFAGLVIKMEIKGIDQRGLSSLLSVGAGEVWDDFVDYAVKQGFYGIENLSSIPGTVGATPVQNIGAYGCDVSSSILTVHAFDTNTMKFVDFSNDDCKFEYRDSVFKRQKGRYIITRVDFRLIKNGNVNIEYEDLRVYFDKFQTSDNDLLKRVDNRMANIQRSLMPTLDQVRQAVIKIRAIKLPDWKKWGTAGSFFKNPIISADKFAELTKKYPDLPGFSEPDGRIKVSLGWILDKICNVKGLMIGNVGTYEKQALVLVSKPGATAEEIVVFAHDLMKRVKEKTGIDIEGEVECVN